MTFTVPFTAEVGKSHKVRAVAETDSAGPVVTVDAEARHLVPRATIAIAPASVSPGDRLTISGQNLPPFSRVGPIRIEGIDVFNNAGIVTDENGSFEAEVLVPNLDFGDQTLLVQVEEAIVTRIIEGGSSAPQRATRPGFQIPDRERSIINGMALRQRHSVVEPVRLIAQRGDDATERPDLCRQQRHSLGQHERTAVLPRKQPDRRLEPHILEVAGRPI